MENSPYSSGRQNVHSFIHKMASLSTILIFSKQVMLIYVQPWLPSFPPSNILRVTHCPLSTTRMQYIRSFPPPLEAVF